MQNLSIHDIDMLCQRYLTILYTQNLSTNTLLKQDKKHLPETSGEILYKSVNKLLFILNLKKDDVFADLGSGIGKVVIQVFLRSIAKECIGIEIVPEFHDIAQNAATKLLNDLPEFNQEGRKLKFLQGSFLEIPFTTATVVWVNSTCFNPDLVNALGNIIDLTMNIHTVITTRPIHNLSNYTFVQATRIDCSWDFSLCYIYKRTKSIHYQKT